MCVCVCVCVYHLSVVSMPGALHFVVIVVIIIIIIIVVNLFSPISYLEVVSQDLNKKSKSFTPALYKCCVQCPFEVILQSTADLGRSQKFFITVPNAPIITGTIFVLTFHILPVSSLNLQVFFCNFLIFQFLSCFNF